MAPPQACRYYKSAIGCRNGASCKFLHVVNISAPETTISPLEARSTSGTGDNNYVPVGTCRYYWTRGACTRGATCTFLHQTPGCPTPLVPPARVPQGVCRAYWTTGQCKRSAECRYAHRANPNTAPLDTQNIKMIEPEFIDTKPEVLPSIESDKYSSGIGSSVTPTEANGHLKPFMQDDFRFQGAAQVYLFLEHICSANTQNPHWKPEDGLNHLGKLVKGNGILRMNDAINYPWTRHVGIKWSFQRGYLPLLTYMSSEWVVKSAANHEVNALYSLIDRNTEAFCDTITQSMAAQMQANTFQEQDSPPLSGVQVFRALFITLLEYTTRFRAAATNPAVRRLIQRSAGWFDEWLRGLGPPPLFQDEITTYEEARYVFLIESLSRLKTDVLNATATAPSSPRPQPPYTNTSRLPNALGIPSHSHTVPAPHSPVAPFPKNPGHRDSPNHRLQVNPRPPQRTDHCGLKGTPSPATVQPRHGDRPQAVSGRTLLSEWLLLCDQGERGESNDNFAGLLAGFTAEKIYRLSDIKDRSEADFLAMEFPTTPGGPTFRMARGTAIRLRQYIAADI